MARPGTSFAVPADRFPSLPQVGAEEPSVRSIDEPAVGDLALGLAMTAHELRTPLLGARAAVERLLGARSGSRARASRVSIAKDLRLLEATERELAELSERVEQLLRWSVDAQALRLASADLSRIVREAVVSCRRERPGREILLCSARSVPVRADAVHLRGAVQNLLRNSLAYSPASSPVLVTVLRRSGAAVVRIRDHGPGIPLDERALLFDPFQRGGSARGRRGHGLGLFIAKRIVDAHGGSITMRTASGGGSCFRISLPGRPT